MMSMILLVQVIIGSRHYLVLAMAAAPKWLYEKLGQNIIRHGHIETGTTGGRRKRMLFSRSGIQQIACLSLAGAVSENTVRAEVDVLIGEVLDMDNLFKLLEELSGWKLSDIAKVSLDIEATKILERRLMLAAHTAAAAPAEVADGGF